jgi:hypothetical protein
VAQRKRRIEEHRDRDFYAGMPAPAAIFSVSPKYGHCASRGLRTEDPSLSRHSGVRRQVAGVRGQEIGVYEFVYEYGGDARDAVS